MDTALLKDIPLFATLTAPELEALKTHVERHTYPAHTVIFWMDEPGERLFIVERGEVRITQPNEEGKERTLNTLHAGAFFGELSLLDGGPHTATARAVSETALLTISRAAFYNFLDEHPEFSRTLLAVLVDRLRISTQHMRGANITETPYPGESPFFRELLEGAARRVASGGFLISVMLLLLGWIVVQTVLYKQYHHRQISFIDEPPTFFFLGFLLTLTSFILTILVLTSQRRQADRDRQRSEIEYQVNVKAQAEIMRLQLKMDELLDVLKKEARREKQA